MERSLRVLRELRRRGREAAEALTALGGAGIIVSALADRLAGAVRLRNILVHGYRDLDHGRLFDELEWIEAAAEFAVVVERWLEETAA
jgi:uncharacterized protein YutE (UPF0331/DUF86 family)